MSRMKRYTAAAKACVQSRLGQKLLFWAAFGMIVTALMGFGYTAFIDEDVAKREEAIRERQTRLRGAMQLQREAIEAAQRIQQWRARIDMLRADKAEDSLIFQHEMQLLREHITMANLAIESAFAASVITVEQKELLLSQLKDMYEAIEKKSGPVLFYLNPSAGFNQIDDLLGRGLPEHIKKVWSAQWRITGHSIRKQLGKAAADAWRVAHGYILRVDEGIEREARNIKEESRTAASLKSRKFRVLVGAMFLNALGLLIGSVREFFEKFREPLAGSTS